MIRELILLAPLLVAAAPAAPIHSPADVPAAAEVTPVPCPGGLATALDFLHDGIPTRLFVAMGTGQAILVQDRDGETVIWFGAVSAENVLTFDPAVTLAQARAKYARPCDYLDLRRAGAMR